ncbi:helix-turn-helix domain-containing protein [Streptomyces telluris]|uniref:Helix-turn-helix domain-containing protein n=1 Tax=Streptomyces telluris TaxID=2720021 RepID=A0A9X2LLM9_9ACTN|nr:helix-turn-helix domain-containing protein [Streptomyces telluris]MCQ8774066.1 helix-turn-helix domain-containing protein [Streptomyces telluris]
MTGISGPALSFAEAFDLPLVVGINTAARAFGVCPDTAYKLISLGRFPCPVLRLGRHYRVPTAGMLRALGIDEMPVYAADLEAGPDDPAHHTVHPVPEERTTYEHHDDTRSG